MTKHTSWAIALTATTFLSAPAIAASLAPTLEENSVFSYSEGSENDYNFTLQEPDADGNLSTKYYKIDLKPEAFATSKNVSWTAVGEDQKDAADVVAVQLPNNQTKYFKYTYTQPEGYETITKPELVLPTVTNPAAPITYQPGAVAVNNAAGNNYGDIKNKLFKDNRVNGNIVGYKVFLMVQGGVIYNAGTIGDINADFINNSLDVVLAGEHVNASANGSAIFNAGKIHDINGNFIGNFALSGGTGSGNSGAIYNAEGGTVNSITGNFVKNSGGAIFNGGKINNISGKFIGNYTPHAPAGAISNDIRGTIDNISADFIGNYAPGVGAIDNIHGTIGDINGDFIGNYAIEGNAGAIYASGNIGNITGNFIGNHAYYWGGAIYSYQVLNKVTLGNIVGDFIGNFSINGTGGAISNYKATIGDITGDFIGNYVKKGPGGAIENAGTIGNITGDFLNN